MKFSKFTALTRSNLTSIQWAVAALNATIEEIRTTFNNTRAGDENKDDIFFIMSAFEDFFIRFAEENLNDTSPEFTYRSNKFGKWMFWVVCEFCWRTWDLRPLLMRVRHRFVASGPGHHVHLHVLSEHLIITLPSLLQMVAFNAVRRSFFSLEVPKKHITSRSLREAYSTVGTGHWKFYIINDIWKLVFYPIHTEIFAPKVYEINFIPVRDCWLLIGRTVFVTSEKYRPTNHRPRTALCH